MSVLPPLVSVQSLVRALGLSARKQLSQNFLFNQNITDKVARLGKLEGRRVLEIGPGPGCLTRSILACNPEKCWAVELDRRFEPALEMLSEAVPGKLDVHFGDILKYDYEQQRDDPIDVIMGNLPYQISAPLLIGFARRHCRGQSPFHSVSSPTLSSPTLSSPTLVLMFQREVANRIHAPTGAAHRSRISVAAQAFFETRVPMYVKAQSYVPAPKVDGGVVVLKPRPNAHIVDDETMDWSVFEEVITAAFNQPRRKIRVALMRLAATMKITPEELLSDVDIDPAIRVRHIEALEFKRLAVAVARRRRVAND